jgi:hypothetical protein
MLLCARDRGVEETAGVGATLGAGIGAFSTTGAGLGATARTGCAGCTAGDDCALDFRLAATTGGSDGAGLAVVGAGVLFGGGGNGVMPIPAASFAAAAAAAEAYFNVSPGGFVGGGAGFIVGAGVIVVTGGAGCIVASAGSGDLSCIVGTDGRLTCAVVDGAGVSGFFAFGGSVVVGGSGGCTSTGGSNSGVPSLSFGTL